MRVVIESAKSERAICRLFGSLEHESAAQLRAAMAACTAFDDLCLDLAGVQFMDSAGVHVLVAGVRRIREAGGRVTVVGARRNIRRLLELIGFDRVVPMSDGPVPLPIASFAESAAV